jgi:hypothetical protein
MRIDETIHISWANHGVVDSSFAISLLDIVRLYPDQINSYNSIYGLGLLAKTRNLMVKHFLDGTKEDWLFMVDSDEFITTKAFSLLTNVADKDKAPIISGLCFGNGSQFDIDPSPCIFIIQDGLLVPFRDYPEDSVVEIEAAGTGCLLIHRSVLEKIREGATDPDWAWFQDGPTGNNTWVSEDLTFSARVAEAGYQMLAHTGAVFPHHKAIWITDAHFKAANK